MRVVWSRHPVTAAEIVQQLGVDEKGGHPKTTRTLLARLVTKGALLYKRRGREYSYRPAVSERECVAAASDSFLDRVFGGALRPMLLHFAERQQLTAQDIEELKRRLEEKP